MKWKSFAKRMSVIMAAFSGHASMTADLSNVKNVMPFFPTSSSNAVNVDFARAGDADSGCESGSMIGSGMLGLESRYGLPFGIGASSLLERLQGSYHLGDGSEADHAHIWGIQDVYMQEKTL